MGRGAHARRTAAEPELPMANLHCPWGVRHGQWQVADIPWETGRAQRPRQTGARFSTKARVPSAASSERIASMPMAD